jgi:hypothetical protein
MKEQKREATEIEVIGPDGVRMTKKRAEVTEADCVREVDDAIKDMNPYEKELFFQRLERRLSKPPLKRTVIDGCVVLQPRRWAKA